MLLLLTPNKKENSLKSTELILHLFSEAQHTTAVDWKLKEVLCLEEKRLKEYLEVMLMEKLTDARSG